MYSETRKSCLGIAAAFFALSWITVALRVLVRAGMLRSFGPDDWTMLATQLLFTAYLICQLGGILYGTGEHLSNLEPIRAQKALSFWYFCEAFYVVSTGMLKVSIGLFLLRVATKPVHLWLIRVIMVFSAVFGGAFLFVVIFQCWPISDWWSLNPADKHCINPTVIIGLTYGVSALNVVADWTIGILPIFIVKDLQMSLRQRRLVSVILSFAAIGSTATIVRLPYIGSLRESFLGWNGDFLYSTSGLAIWTTIEVGVGISAGSVATLRPLIRMAFDKLGLGSSSHKTPILGPLRGIPPALPLDGRIAGHGITTTITGNHDHIDVGRLYRKSHRSRSSSQEQLAWPQKGDITKQVVVEFDELDDFDESPRSRGQMLTAVPSSS
ncbi:integral membrane protein [Teratosphaeria destructans]|uniref:Integral membrane protein n=1 Tax=Teratosphaeria destructans TaxID=418781 RepID=A0A9W7SI16_9PEZI|nr:integral membrane protein [Teratosphaeria destructans]